MPFFTSGSFSHLAVREMSAVIAVSKSNSAFIAVFLLSNVVIKDGDYTVVDTETGEVVEA